MTVVWQNRALLQVAKPPQTEEDTNDPHRSKAQQLDGKKTYLPTRTARLQSRPGHVLTAVVAPMFLVWVERGHRWHKPLPQASVSSVFLSSLRRTERHRWWCPQRYPCLGRVFSSVWNVKGRLCGVRGALRHGRQTDRRRQRCSSSRTRRSDRRVQSMKRRSQESGKQVPEKGWDTKEGPAWGIRIHDADANEGASLM